ncbi:MAG: hypothetical protein AAF202_01820, partial [Pseudomonadota bacterium]
KQFIVAGDFQDKGVETVQIKALDPQMMTIRILKRPKLRGNYSRVTIDSANLSLPTLTPSALRQVEESIRRL